MLIFQVKLGMSICALRSRNTLEKLRVMLNKSLKEDIDVSII
ncbi:hypothetical protein LLB_3622 [Legionella longbeachae D-4968]|nr:hypothetical protein LLB_3622 [Legionella longbeachae D-4968]